MSTPETADESWRKEGIRWGIMAGGIVVTLFAGVYFLNRPLVLNRGLWLGTALIYALGMWQAQKTVDDDELRSYIQPGFLTFVIANALFYLYYYFLFAVFDPELVDLQADLLRENGQDPADAAVPTVRSTIFTYAQSLIFGFGLAAAIGFILSRRERPNE
ncbi:MAG: DUF4199 family protein [Bacteroidota bacterium]